VHANARRDGEPLVAVQPARVGRREDVRLEPEAGEMLRQLQGPLDTAPAGGWEIEGNEQDTHRRDRMPAQSSPARLCQP